AEPTDGILDAALLPGVVRVAEEGLAPEGLADLVVQGELGAVVEGERAAELGGNVPEGSLEVGGDGDRGSADLTPEDHQSAAALDGKEDGDACNAEGHSIDFPVAGFAAVEDVGALGDGASLMDEAGRAPATLAEPAPPGFAAGKQAVPVIGLGRAMVDEAVDCFMADDDATMVERQPASDLFRRLSHRKALTDQFPQARLARQLEPAVPASSPLRQLLRPNRVIAATP